MAAPTLNLKCFPSISTLTLDFRSLLRPTSASFPIPRTTFRRPILCRAAKNPSSSTTTTDRSSSNKNKSNKSKNAKRSKSTGITEDSSNAFNEDATSTTSSPSSLPKPPAGFVVDDRGKLISASKHRLATLVDPKNKLPLECVVRREFTSSQGHECMLLCPVDMPVQVLRSTGVGWSDVSDEEFESILPGAAYALAKIRMYLVYSGYCYTARGGFSYSEENIFDFHADGKEADDLPTEGVEITHFNQEGEHYMIYTPSDPLLFVAVKDQKGMLQIADDDLLEDPAVTSAIDEETEFNALVEEEAALLDSLLGKR